MNLSNGDTQLLALGVFHQPQNFAGVFPVEVFNR